MLVCLLCYELNNFFVRVKPCWKFQFVSIINKTQPIEPGYNANSDWFEETGIESSLE